MICCGRFAVVWAVLASCLLISSTRAEDAVAFKHENDPENLKALFQRMHQALHAEKDLAGAMALFQQLCPDEARLKPGLKEDIAPETLQAIIKAQRAFQEYLASDKADVRTLVRAQQTEVKVHGATTEAIIMGEPGTLVYKTFPNGVIRAAPLALRPGTTYYVVELKQPNTTLGVTQYHLLYWDGRQWSILIQLHHILPQNDGK